MAEQFSPAQLVKRIDIPQWQADSSSRECRDIIKTFTGDTVVAVPVGTKQDVTDAFERARKAQVEWGATPPSERARVLQRFSDLVYAHREDLMDIAQLESGKARAHALEEVIDTILVARYYAKNGPAWLRTRSIPGALPVLTKAKILHHPVGVVGVISPWNYPISLAATDETAALMAGNAIVLKPDSQTPLSALAIARLYDMAGLPKDLWQIVTGPGGVVGSEITDQCDFLMFTGSSKTGRALGDQIGGRLVGYSAELGGKNPMIVDEDVDYDGVADIATRACYSNAGQLCISIERIYAVGDAYEKFSRAFARRIKEMKLGAGPGWDIEMGSLTGQNQLDVVTEHVDDAVEKGARVLAGGKARPDLGPYFYEPTLLADVPPEAICYRAETFGPVVSIYPASSLDDAIEQANDTEYGLNASVFCADDAVAEDVAARVQTGSVNINEGYASAWSSLDGPLGGWGISGIGARHGRIGLLKYTKSQTIAIQSKLMHLGGPSFLPRDLWFKIFPTTANLMKYMPGR